MTKYAGVIYIKGSKFTGNEYTYINPIEEVAEGDVVVVEVRDTVSLAQVVNLDITEEQVEKLPYQINKRIIGTVSIQVENEVV